MRSRTTQEDSKVGASAGKRQYESSCPQKTRRAGTVIPFTLSCCLYYQFNVAFACSEQSMNRSTTLHW